ncbi:MAG: hypothetical protein IPG55_18915 [Saprospiraceae bacterium]|nr:hypothetical protein [Candidatus Defluviibacterium haderslevense]MBK7242944.1 hypothetical protein [Candidatus Defluviibacterium haderslevense]
MNDINGLEHYTDQLFREKLVDAVEPTQDHLWEGIVTALNKEQNKNRIFSFGWIYKFLVSLMILSLGALALYYFINKNSSKDEQNKKELFKEASFIQDKNLTFKSKTYNNNESSNSLESDNDNVINENKVEQKEDYSSQFSNVKKVSDKKIKNYKAVNRNKEQIMVRDFSILESANELNESKSNNANLIDENQDLFTGIISQVEKIDDKESLIDYLVNSPKKMKLTEENPCFVKRETHNRYYFDAYYTPEISQKRINSKSETSIKYANERNGSERYVNAYSFGFGGSIVLPSGLSLRTGVNFSTIKERFEFIKERQTKTLVRKDAQGVPIDTITEETIIPGHIYNKYRFVDIPITIGYEINLADFKFAVNGGVGINVTTNHEGSVYAPDIMKLLSLKQEDEAVASIYKKNVGFSIIGSFGLNYKINDRFMILAEPSIRYYVGSIAESSYALTHKYMQVGLIAGIRYRIK